MAITNGTQIGGESEYETDPAQLQQLREQAAEAKISREYEGDPAQIEDIRKAAEEAQTSRAAERAYKLQEEAEGNIREFNDQRLKQQQIDEEYGIATDYKKLYEYANPPPPQMAPGPGGWMQTPEAIMPTLGSAATTYAETVLGSTYLAQKGIEGLGSKTAAGGGKFGGGIDAGLKGASWLVGFGGTILAVPGTIPIAVANIYKADKDFRTTTYANVQDLLPPETGIEEFTGTTKFISARQARGQARGEILGDMWSGGVSTAKSEGQEFLDDPWEVKGKKLGYAGLVAASYVVGVGAGAFAYRGLRKGIVKAAGVKSGAAAGEKVARRADILFQPHEIAIERGVGGLLLGKGGRAGGKATFPRAYGFYMGKMKGSPIPSEVIGEYWIAGGTKVWSKLTGKKIAASTSKYSKTGRATSGGGIFGTAGVQTTTSKSKSTAISIDKFGEPQNTIYDRYTYPGFDKLGKSKTYSATETDPFAQGRTKIRDRRQEADTYLKLSRKDKKIFMSQTPSERAKWANEFSPEFTTGTTKGTTRTKTATDRLFGGKSKTYSATETDPFAQGRTKIRTTRSGSGSNVGTDSLGDTGIFSKKVPVPGEGEPSYFVKTVPGTTTTQTPTETPIETPVETPTPSSTTSTGLGAAGLLGLLKKKKPSARARGPVDFSFSSTWTKSRKYESAELSIMDLGTVYGKQSNGGSLLGGSVLGGSSVLGSAILGRPPKGGKLL
tara:strand:+ start:1461 stop:3629 length:2169 start_codon:yes stop_codon:yes gene_type:complete